MQDKLLVVIPCRNGSIRFHEKNTALFNGTSLVENTINIAKEAGLTNILVTTNDPKVKELVQGKDVTILDRPIDLSFNDTPTESAVHQAVIAADYDIKINFDTICVLQVTSPLLQASSLKTAVGIYFSRNLDSLTAVDMFYQPVGAFYMVDKSRFIINKSFYQDDGLLYFLPPDQCLDIDYKYQLNICELVSKKRYI